MKHLSEIATPGNPKALSLVIVLVSLLLSACASTQNLATDPENDPWEPFNRKMYTFNSALDTAVLRPIAIGYDKVMPDPLQRGVGNFFHNLKSPVTIVNLALQGKFKDSLKGTGRFLLNSTVGLLGFIDVASKAGIPDYDEDLGQTLAVWGYENSRYLVLPFFGPSTIRDGFGTGLDSYIDPVSYAAREKDEYAPMIFSLIHTRASLLPQEALLEDAFDPYVLVRDAYLQRRTFLIYDGEPPLPDYDDYLDELEEFEENE